MLQLHHLIIPQSDVASSVAPQANLKTSSLCINTACGWLSMKLIFGRTLHFKHILLPESGWFVSFSFCSYSTLTLKSCWVLCLCAQIVTPDEWCFFFLQKTAVVNFLRKTDFCLNSEVEWTSQSICDCLVCHLISEILLILFWEYFFLFLLIGSKYNLFVKPYFPI